MRFKKEVTLALVAIAKNQELSRDIIIELHNTVTALDKRIRTLEEEKKL